MILLLSFPNKFFTLVLLPSGGGVLAVDACFAVELE